jgi:hypothetical protein
MLKYQQSIFIKLGRISFYREWELPFSVYIWEVRKPNLKIERYFELITITIFTLYINISWGRHG